MQTRLAAVFCCVVAISGCRVVEPPPAPEAPRITSFTASKTRIASGEEVTLSFATANASKVELLDDAGHAVQAEGTASSGTAKVAPTRSSFYVLRATGQGGRDTAFVQIAVNEPLKDVFLLAVPATIGAGESAQLLWGAAGASSVTLTAGSGSPQTLTGTTGTVTVSPTATERYTLTAQGAPGTPPLTAIATVDVHPVLLTANVAAPGGLLPGEIVTFSWTSAGAQRIVVSERTFGTLATITDAAGVNMGTFDWTLPATLAGGIAVVDGLPLQLVITATAGEQTAARTFERVVGRAPKFRHFEIPALATSGDRFTISWLTEDCDRLTILAGGLPVFETVPGDVARATEGQVTLPAPNTMSEYVLVARNEFGLETRVVGQVRAVGPPQIDTFTLTSAVNVAGDTASAQWTTTNATLVVLRVADGPVVKTFTGASVASGNASLTPAGTTTLELAAFNAAGQVATQRKTVRVNTPAVGVSPTTALRGSTVDLTWDFSALSIVEVVGNDSAPTILPSGNFIDLAQATGTRELFFDDPARGSARVPAIDGFRFWTLGMTHPELWVSVNGFITYSQPSGDDQNVDLSDTAQARIAPFWDDLVLGANSKVLVGLSLTTSGERVLVIQWDHVQLAADPTSDLTFETQLFESGQVSFAYQTLTGATDSATVGIRDRGIRQVSHNNTPPAPGVGSEVVFFVDQAAQIGSIPLIAADSEALSVVGRSATGLVFGSAQLKVIGSGDVVITEVMAQPEASVATTGQWIELRNNQPEPIDLGGFVLTTLGSTPDGGFVFPVGTVVDAGAHLVVGQSLDLLETGGAPVSLVLADAPIQPTDVITLRWNGALISTLAFDGGVAGTSQLEQPRVLTSGPAITCTRSATFGSAGALGTPGAANEPCDAYAFAKVGASVIAPPATAALPFTDFDDDAVEVPLPVPFSFYGTQYSRVTVSTNGFITFQSLTSSYPSNKTTPSSSTPKGSIALMWDDLDGNANPTISLFRAGRRTIVSWNDMTRYAYDGALNMQLHLLDDGAIEFHYDEASWVASGDQSNLTGGGATVWIESPDGQRAVAAGINTAGTVMSQTGYRFTPTP